MVAYDILSLRTAKLFCCNVMNSAETESPRRRLPMEPAFMSQILRFGATTLLSLPNACFLPEGRFHTI
jgi:hypothetical protein